MGALKRAEGNDGFILRLHETAGTEENIQVELPLLKRSLPLLFHPFEIKTIFLPDDESLPPREMLLTEM